MKVTNAELVKLFGRIQAALDGEQTDPQALADLDEDIEAAVEQLRPRRLPTTSAESQHYIDTGELPRNRDDE